MPDRSTTHWNNGTKSPRHLVPAVARPLLTPSPVVATTD
jgi:hypothetical protein